jgi:hypothetical protein
VRRMDAGAPEVMCSRRVGVSGAGRPSAVLLVGAGMRARGMRTVRGCDCGCGCGCGRGVSECGGEQLNHGWHHAGRRARGVITPLSSVVSQCVHPGGVASNRPCDTGRVSAPRAHAWHARAHLIGLRGRRAQSREAAQCRRVCRARCMP